MLSLVTVLLAAVSVSASGAPLQQDRAAAPTQQGKPTTTTPRTGRGSKASKAWRVRVSSDVPHLISVRAKDALLSEIASDLGRQLKLKVVLSPVMKTQRVTLDFDSLMLENALLMLAPQPYIDYVIPETPSATRTPIAIYLQGVNEKEPAPRNSANTDVQAVQFMVIEGDTEAPTENPYLGKPESEQPLVVNYNADKKTISVRARKREMISVLQLIAAKTGMEAELSNYNPSDEKSRELLGRLTELVDVDFKDYTVEDAVRSLTKDVRVYLRTDLLNSNTTPIRMVLAIPAKTSADNSNKSAN